MDATPNFELEVVEPTVVPEKSRKSRLPSRISDRKLDQALKELDLVSLSSKQLRCFGTVGRFLDQIGIVQYGNGRLVGTAQAISDGIRACAEVVSNPKTNNDEKERFLTLQIRLAKALDANIALLTENNGCGQPKKPQPEQQNKPFAIQGVVTPIHINIAQGIVATPQKAG